MCKSDCANIVHVIYFLQRGPKDLPVLVIEIKRQISDVLSVITDADLCEVFLQASYTLRNRNINSCWFCICDVTHFHYMRLATRHYSHMLICTNHCMFSRYSAVVSSTRSISSHAAARERVTSKIAKFQDGGQFLNIVGAIYGTTHVYLVLA